LTGANALSTRLWIDVVFVALCSWGVSQGRADTSSDPALVHQQAEIEEYWTPDPAYSSGPMNYDCSRAHEQLRKYRSITLHKRFLIDENGRVKNYELVSSSHPDYDWRCTRSLELQRRYLPSPSNPQRRPLQFDGEVKDWIPD
jgi:hypothetical protein